MSMSPRLSDAALAGRVHPRTGEPIVPIGVLPSGKVVWPIMGGSGEEPDANEADNSSGDDADEDEPDDDEEDPEGSDKSGKGSDEDAEKDPQKKISALEDEKNRQYRRRKDAERERDDLKARLDALENKDKPETDLLKKENETLKSTNESLQTDLTGARLQIAFLQDNTYEWHNPGRALKLADLSEVEIDDDGKVHGLKAALDALVKTDPYLVKDKTTSKDDKDKTPPKSTPGQPKRKTNSDDKSKDDRTTMSKKYPGLRR